MSDTWCAPPEISARYISSRAPPATHFNHPLISRRKESNLDKSLKIGCTGIDRKVSLSAAAPRVKNTVRVEFAGRGAAAQPSAARALPVQRCLANRCISLWAESPDYPLFLLPTFVIYQNNIYLPIIPTLLVKPCSLFVTVLDLRFCSLKLQYKQGPLQS